MKKIISFIFIIIIGGIIFSSFKNKQSDLDYIAYYNKVNSIDSIIRYAHDTLSALSQYTELFKQYPPKNDERIREFETYIKLSDKLGQDFGGKESLYKLIPLYIPPRKDGIIRDPNFFKLYQKYGIDSTEVLEEVSKWKRGLNKQLIDSFTVAVIRDQYGRAERNIKIVRKNENINANLFKWTFENFGFPSVSKIGVWSNKENIFFPMRSFITHMATSKDYPYFKDKLLEYVKSGDCTPIDYSYMVDTYHINKKEKTYYGMGRTLQKSIDTVEIDAHRRSIGLPSLKHTSKINKDFENEIKEMYKTFKKQ
ncbi:hypothetical protein KRE40_18425 [Elizabethkingia meningoseptica]|uniref:hypothetical protein n=1 Tax=Elizabethkingia meningoseptica TaxID=238 RepID=UPI0016294B71|nr:hypothetical protein [Elizabethkingia meningoseptica]MCT3649902.1 hypothetical protein [Elizabethkingia anophelis]MCT3697031.1 hypothetical protein [Elizabethkingia anophelis]MCT3860986.1 hypothetical protein [Elizabethkingia anophelis]MCT3946775.1 hypothetical protein [Elizabethkingia anophelis]MCT3996413.1 hypothetical protein [Elizabethkingia anophelis]